MRSYKMSIVLIKSAEKLKQDKNYITQFSAVRLYFFIIFLVYLVLTLISLIFFSYIFLIFLFFYKNKIKNITNKLFEI